MSKYMLAAAAAFCFLSAQGAEASQKMPRMPQVPGISKPTFVLPTPPALNLPPRIAGMPRFRGR
jgi:hypothetical protein